VTRSQDELVLDGEQQPAALSRRGDRDSTRRRSTRWSAVTRDASVLDCSGTAV